MPLDLLASFPSSIPGGPFFASPTWLGIVAWLYWYSEITKQITSDCRSTNSGSGSLSLSDHITSGATVRDIRLDEIKQFGDGLRRLENKRLEQQRFVPSAEKSENLSKLALGAKVERALRRRMTSQDAVMRKQVPLNEKKSLNANAEPSQLS